MNPKTTSELQSNLANLRREGEERSARQFAQRTGHPYVDLTKAPVSVDALSLLEEAEAKDAKLAVIEHKANRIAVAALNPKLPATEKAVQKLKEQKYEVGVFVASASGLKEAWQFYKFVKKPAEDISGKVKIKPERLEELAGRLVNFAAVQNELKKSISQPSPTLLIEILLSGALALRASDIHLEPGEEKAKVRLRIDGILHDVFNEFPGDTYNLIISRIKLLSGMKINVRDEAQDGRFTIDLNNKEVEIRASVIPSEYGETVVMRILDPSATAIGLNELGIREDDLAVIDRQMSRPNGLILNTGPTGSGKTTTLYAFLRKVNKPEVKIITLEDPIEYHLEGIEQTQVDEESGYTFANGLRAIVRQDPDAILVGEIRDKDTADIALQAALTGHLVLSTLHTNDAIGAVPRLVNLGVLATTIGSALNLVIAQRLVRRICANCRRKKKLAHDLKKKIDEFVASLPRRVDRAKYANREIYEPGGCKSCGGLGYKGRVGIFEFLEGGPSMEEAIIKDASELTLQKLSKEQGMVTMQEDGILKVFLGETSFEEVEEATGKIEWR